MFLCGGIRAGVVTGGVGGGGVEPVLYLGGIRVGVAVGELELVLSLWGN